MAISTRSRYSLSQFLELQETEFVIVLLSKYGIRISIEYDRRLSAINNCLRSHSDDTILQVLDEVVRTSGDLKARVEPKYRFTERFNDLKRSLELDGYLVQNNFLVPVDPSISDGLLLDDDLALELESSNLPQKEEIIGKVLDSTEAFQKSNPNYNACLNDIRIALETLAGAIASTLRTDKLHSYDSSKWGSIISFLKQTDFITLEEEKGLAGVYGFVSPGSHKPLGLSEDQTARLGRSLALGMCWFLIKTYKAQQSIN